MEIMAFPKKPMMKMEMLFISLQKQLFYNSDENEFYIDNTNLDVGTYICKPDSTDKMAISKSGTLTGVYNMNKGYADFKQITILEKMMNMQL